MKIQPLLRFVLAAGALAFPASAQAFDIKLAKLQILWSSPLASDPAPAQVVGKLYDNVPMEKGFVLDDVAMFADGRIVFLGDRLDGAFYTHGLIIDAEHHGPDAAATPNLKGALASLFESPKLSMHEATRAPEVRSITASGTGTIWVGGFTNDYMGIASDSHDDAYVARLDSGANPVWERAYKPGGAPMIIGMAATSTGDVAVAAIDDVFESSWLALISGGNGHLIWQRRLGDGHGIAIVPAAEDGFLVASLEQPGGGMDYAEDVSVRTVSKSGQLGPDTIIRQAMNDDIAAVYTYLGMSPAYGGAYVISTREGSSDARSKMQPTEVAKVSAAGKLLWSNFLPDSYVADPGSGDATFCDDPGIATLPNGDVLVACALNGQLHLHELNQTSGDDEHVILPAPACNDGFPLALFLVARKDGAVFLGGSRPDGNEGPGCSWFGRLVP